MKSAWTSGKSGLGIQTRKYLQAVCSSTSTWVHSFSHLVIRLVVVIAVVIMSIKMLIMVMVIAMVIAVSIKMPIMAVVIAMVITDTASQQDCIFNAGGGGKFAPPTFFLKIHIGKTV